VPRLSNAEVIAWLAQQDPTNECVMHTEQVADPEHTTVLDFLWSDL
jgi:hypothetical protein